MKTNNRENRNPILEIQSLDQFPENTSKFYQKIITYDLILKQNVTTVMQLARLEKIVLNTSSRIYVSEKKTILSSLSALEVLSGQKPQLTYARKSIANFKLRQSQILGCRVILLRDHKNFFLEKLSQIVFPRDLKSPMETGLIKKVRLKFSVLGSKIRPKLESKNEIFGKEGLPKFLILDGNSRKGQVAVDFGFQNPMIFPELENHYQLIEGFRGFNCTFIVSKSNFSRGLLMLSGFQLPVAEF